MREEYQQYPITKENIEASSISTILNVWSMIDWEKVDAKRAYGIWDELVSKINASVRTTNSYETFVSKLCRKLEIRSLKYNEIAEISAQTEEYKQEILKLLRNSTQLIVLKVRLKNEIKKEEREQERLRIQKEKELTKQLSNTVIFNNKGDVLIEG